MSNTIRKSNTWEETLIAFPSDRSLSMLSLDAAEHDDNRMRISLDQQKFKIRLASSEDRHASASMLIHKMYSWRGYATEGVGQTNEPNQITIVASYAERIMGTMTIGLDSPAGLLADENSKKKPHQWRAEGHKVSELVRLAVDRELKSMRVLAALFHLAYIYGHIIHQATDAVIEVHRRHMLFYEKMLGFKPFGEERICPRTQVPASLMRIEGDYMEQMIARFGGKGEQIKDEKSLYPFFFSHTEEAAITQRLTHEP